MSFDAIGKKVGVSGLEGPEVDMRAAARDLNKPTKKYEENAVSGFIRGAGQADGPTAEQAFDLFKAIGDLFSGGQQPQRNGKEAANKFDLGAILSSIFDFAGKQAEKSGALPPKEEHHVKGEERVEVSGETGDEHFKAKGRAAAEAHAKANAFSETFIDGSGVGVRGGAEASAGVSAEAEGSITTDIGSLDGKARVSAEVYARLYGEARAGPDGVSAAGKAEVGAMANADAETNLQIADGLIAGHADAHAQAGAGGKANAKAAVTFDPPEAIIQAKAESFAGARAGYSAKGGIAGVGYGVEAEVWAGAGAKAEINGGLEKDGKFKLQFSLGIAAGVGCMVKINFEFDTKIFGKVAGDIIGAVGGVFGDLFGAVAGLFDGGSGDGKRAGKAIGDAIKQIAPLLGDAAAKAAKEELGPSGPGAKATKEDTSADATGPGAKATKDHASSEKKDRPEPKKDSSFKSEKHGTLVEGTLS